MCRKMKKFYGNKTNDYIPTLKDGWYVCKILLAVDSEDKEYVYFIYDVCEGEQKDFFQREQEDVFETKKNLTNRAYLSYKSTGAMTFALQRLDAISWSNPGFDARDAWRRASEATDIRSKVEVLKEFEGKTFGAYIEERNVYQNGGFKNIKNAVAQMVPADYVRKGLFSNTEGVR